MKNLSYFIVFLLIISPLCLQDVFGSLPFGRQEIRDNVGDLKLPDGTLVNGEKFVDLKTISYLNDGQFLNATLFLGGAFKYNPEREMVSYGILIDVDSNNETGLHGFDYKSEIMWNGENWNRSFQERTSLDDTRVIEFEENYIGFFDKTKNNVRIYLDLDSMGSPDEYSLSFFAKSKKIVNGSNTIIADYSNLIHVPPPEFIIFTSPESIILKQDEAETTLLEVRTTTGSQPKVSLKVEPLAKIEIKLIPEEIFIPSHGIGTALLHIKALDDTKISPKKLIISADATFPLDSLTRTQVVQNKIVTVQLEENYEIKNTAAISLEIESSLTAEEKFLKFLERWEIPITIVVAILTSGGIIFGSKRVYGFIKELSS